MAASGSQLLQVVAASGQEVLISISPPVHRELCDALVRGELAGADVYWRASLRCSVAEEAHTKWSLPPLAALTLCSSLEASCASSPALDHCRLQLIQQCEAALAAHFVPVAPPRLQVADLNKVVKGSQLSSRQVGFMPGFLLVFGGKGEGARLYPSRCVLSERIKTEDTIEIEYVEDDKPSTKHLLCLRASTSAAAAAVHTAIRDIRHGCSGAASQFGEGWDALVVASALHAVMDSADSLAKIRAHFVSSRLFHKVDLDSLAPAKPEALLYVARGLAWRSLQLPLAAVCDFTWGLTFSKRGDKTHFPLQRARLAQLRRLCSHIMHALRDEDTAAATLSNPAAAEPPKGWAASWNATRDLKLGIIAVALQWIKRETADLKRAPAPPPSSTSRSLGSGEKLVSAEDQISVTSSYITRAVDSVPVSSSLAAEAPLSIPVISLETAYVSPPSPPPVAQSARRSTLGRRGSVSDSDELDALLPTFDQIIVFLTGCGVALSDFDLFEASDANAFAAQERSRVETVKLAKYHEVRTWWETQKDASGREMRLSGMKVQSLAGWEWEGSMNRITSLYLDGNKLKEFSWDWVVLLSSLEVLSLEANRIDRISAFLSKDSCKSLVSLKFGGNKLAKLSVLTETIDPVVGARICSISMFDNPFLISLREDGAGAGCDAITAEYTYISSIVSFFPCVSSIDGFTLTNAHFWWVKVLSEFNSGTAALCQAMHPCQSTRTLALAPLLSWACTPVACACFAAIDGVSAVLPLLRYIQDPQAVFCGLMVIRRITSGLNCSSASGLCTSDIAHLFWAVLKRAADDFPHLNEQQEQPLRASTWSPAWTISIATLSLEVLFDAVHPRAPTVSPKVLLSAFAQSAATSLSNVLGAITQILGRGGKVFETLSRSRGAAEGSVELEDVTSAIWGKCASEGSLVNALVGMLPLNQGLSATVSSSPPSSPSATRSQSSASSSPPVDKFFTHSDALASSAYFNRQQRTTSTSANRRSSLLSSQYSGSLMQVIPHSSPQSPDSVSKATKVPDVDAHDSSPSGERAAARVSGVSTQARVRLADCASLIYDCSIALIATAHEECKHLPVLVCQEARRSIFRAWRSDFEQAQLREGSFRYGNEFTIMAELMPLDTDQDLRASGISGSDVVAAGYVAAASARHCLMYLASGSSSKHLFEFRAALSTFFRALFMCDNTPASVDVLRDAAARDGLETPVSPSFIESCLGQTDGPSVPDNLKQDFLRYLNLCVVDQGGKAAARVFLQQVLVGEEQGSMRVDALVVIAATITRPGVSSGAASVPDLVCWLFRCFSSVPFASVCHKSGSSNDAAVAAVSSLCRYALFEATDVNLCALCLTMLHHWLSCSPSLQLGEFIGRSPPSLSHLCSVVQSACPSVALTLSPAVTSFFAHFFDVGELPNRGLHLLLETLKSFSGQHRQFHNAGTVQKHPTIISAIMHPTPLGAAPMRLACELCVRWEVQSATKSPQSNIVLHRSSEVLAAAAAAASQASAIGNLRDFDDACDLQCCSILVHARHASPLEVKLFESDLERFLGMAGCPTPSQLVMTCLSSCLVLESFAHHTTEDSAVSHPALPSKTKSHSSEFLSILPRDKQFELVTDTIMALLRACRAGVDESIQGDEAREASSNAPNIVRSIAAKLALKASRIDMMAMQKLLLDDTLVPFLSGLSSSKVGGGAGDGVDASTVAVINEICERALQSDVAAAVAAARAVAALAEQCLTAGQFELASTVMASLPRLLKRLVCVSAPHSSLQQLATSCGLTFKNVLKAVCNAGRAVPQSLESLWTRTFECISEFLSFESMLASPALAFASERPVIPASAPLMSAALKQDFLPIASKRMMLSSPNPKRLSFLCIPASTGYQYFVEKVTQCAVSALGLSHLIPWKVDDFSQAITCMLIINDRNAAFPPIWWKKAMESVAANLRDNATRLVGQSSCPPCIATAACVCVAISRVVPDYSLSSEALLIVGLLNSATHLVKSALFLDQTCSSASAATASSSCVKSLWFIEFIALMGNLVAMVSDSSAEPSPLLVNFIARDGMSCISDFASVLCRLSRDEQLYAAYAERVQNALSGCCKCYTSMLSVASASSISASSLTRQLISHIWFHACDNKSKAQLPALILIALAVSRHGPAVMSSLAASEADVAAIVQIIVSHIDSVRNQFVASDAEYQASAAESACHVLCECLNSQPSLSATVIPRTIFAHLCTNGWSWARSAVPQTLIDTFSEMVTLPVRPAVKGLASLILGDVQHMQNSSPWLKLVVRLLEINASFVCDVLTDDISLMAADKDSDVSSYATRLLQYSTICSLCGSLQASDEVETVYGFGMGLLFDDAWSVLPSSFHDLFAQRYYLHSFFLSRRVMSQAAVSAAAFSDLLLGSLVPTVGGSAASLSLALMLCPSDDAAGESEEFRLDHLKLPDDFPEMLLTSLETSPPPESNCRAMQISVLFRIGMALNWNAPRDVIWKHRVAGYYALALTLNCPLQHFLLQTISELLLSHLDVLPASLSITLIFRTHQICNDLISPFGQSLLTQICSCLKAGFVTPISLQLLLVNLLKAMDDEACVNILMTRTFILALAAAGSVTPSIVAAEIPDIATICRLAQRHVRRSLAASDAQGAFDLETLQSVQLLCRFGAFDVLVAEGMISHLLRSFDAGIGVVAMKCVIFSVWHAFAPEYAGDAWLRCRFIVSRILLHSSFSDLIIQRDIVITLSEIITHTICIDLWVSSELMPRIASILSSALHFHSVMLIRNFCDVLLSLLPKFDPSIWCEEFIVIISQCCGCSFTDTETPALRLSACRVIYAISDKNASVIASSAVVCHLIEALLPCSASSDSIVLLLRIMCTIASVSSMPLAERFSSVFFSIPLNVMDTFSIDAFDCAVRLILLLSSSSASACKKFIECGSLNFLQFLMQKYSGKGDDSSASLFMLISQLMLKLSLPLDMSEVSSAFAFYLSTWHEKLNEKPFKTSARSLAPPIETHSIDQNGTVLPECASDMDQRFDLKLSPSESSREDFRETLKAFPKLSDVKALFDTFMLHQQESLRQQHQEILSFQEQQMQQMQLQHVLLQRQQHLLEQQQQQLAQQQLKLEQIARQQMSLDLPAVNHNALFPSAPPLSIDMDEPTGFVHSNH